jgi:predicted alpha/beta-hydrolase family hydrolase
MSSAEESDADAAGTPYLDVTEPRGVPVRGIAVVMHGGRARSTAQARDNQLAVLRMRPFAADLRRAGGPVGLTVARLRFGVRGWNGSRQSPVHDARWALDKLATRYRGIPVALVGHSMGGRTAIYAADHPSVAAVVGLAPWLETGDPTDTVAGRRVLIAHGDRDRITNPRASAAWAQAVAPIAASVTYVTVTGERHSMLRRAKVWTKLTTGYVLGVLCPTTHYETGREETTNVLEMALAGEAALVV